MKEYTFKKIDAFATEKSGGNPAGYILLDNLNDISESEMLQIAKELKGFVNEVGYVARVGDSMFDFRYFSSEREVEFCGHDTIAIMYDLIKNNAEVIQINGPRFMGLTFYGYFGSFADLADLGKGLPAVR